MAITKDSKGAGSSKSDQANTVSAKTNSDDLGKFPKRNEILSKLDMLSSELHNIKMMDEAAELSKLHGLGLIQKATSLLENAVKSGDKEIDLSEKIDSWLQLFTSQKEEIKDKLPPLISGKTVFEVKSTDDIESLQEIRNISSSNKGVVICVHNIATAVSHPDIVASLEQNDNHIFQVGEDLVSEVLFKFRHSSKQMEKNEAAKELNYASSQKRGKQADDYALQVKEVIHNIEASGVTTLRGVAKELTNRNIPSPRGNSTWAVSAVKRIKDRLKELDGNS